MNIRVLSKADEAIESLTFHRVIALLRTDQDHEQKLVLTRLICTARGRGKSHMGSLDLVKVSIVSELFSPLLLCVEAPESKNKHTIFCVSGAFTKEKNVVVFGFEFAYFLSKFHATLLVQPACREVSSSGCSSETGAQRFRS